MIQWVFLSYHIRVQSESTFVITWMSLAQKRRDIWKLSEYNGTRTHNQLIHKGIVNHLVKLGKWLNACLRIKWFRVWDPLQSLDTWICQDQQKFILPCDNSIFLQIRDIFFLYNRKIWNTLCFEGKKCVEILKCSANTMKQTNKKILESNLILHLQ